MGSGQLGDGVGFKTAGQVVKAPYRNGLGLDVTVLRRPNYLWRLTGRAWPFTQEASVGTEEEVVAQPGSRVRTAFAGGSLHLLGDEDELGPVGVSLTAGLLVQRVSGTTLGHPQWAAGPVVLLGMDWGWQALYCWFIKASCSHHFLHTGK
jgi:hypothetical protein